MNVNPSDKSTEIAERTPLDPRSIPKYANELRRPPVFLPLGEKEFGDRSMPWYVVDLSCFEQQILPESLPKTRVFGYGGFAADPLTGKPGYFRGAPGPTFEARRGREIAVRWVNRLREPYDFAVDPTLHWANPSGLRPEPPYPPFPPGFEGAQSPVPAVAHLHGGENPPIYDGFPDAWSTAGGLHGPAWRTDTVFYGNTQQAATLWYHDHALGLTRLNVAAGLAGFYLLRDPQCEAERGGALPSGEYELPLVIQDRSFYDDGSVAFPTEGDNPEIHPYWMPEYMGDVVTVNGGAWPNLGVERQIYRFRILNGSNARFYELSFSNGMPFYQIGTDGGFLERPVELTRVLLAPAERADILADFTACRPGEKIRLLNTAAAPYPDGEPADPETVGQVMRFTVGCGREGRACLPCALGQIPRLKPDVPPRILTLNEAMGENGPTSVLLNGQMWDAPVTETPLVGSTGDWKFVNLTADTHPIHLHLVQFQILYRQYLNVDAYRTEWEKRNGDMLPLMDPTVTLSPAGFVTSPMLPPEPNERGWKDTVRANPGQITVIRVRFAPQDAPVCGTRPGMNLYDFDPSAQPGYVWHCHILDHEDNEMMRPMTVLP